MLLKACDELRKCFKGELAIEAFNRTLIVFFHFSGQLWPQKVKRNLLFELRIYNYTSQSQIIERIIKVATSFHTQLNHMLNRNHLQILDAEFSSLKLPPKSPNETGATMFA